VTDHQPDVVGRRLFFTPVTFCRTCRAAPGTPCDLTVRAPLCDGVHLGRHVPGPVVRDGRDNVRHLREDIAEAYAAHRARYERHHCGAGGCSEWALIAYLCADAGDHLGLHVEPGDILDLCHRHGFQLTVANLLRVSPTPTPAAAG
jgi:hypothetical protein